METRPRDSTMHKNIGTGVQKNGRRCSGLMGKNVKYLAAAEGSLFANGLESGTIMSVCRQQWSTVEVPCMFGVAFLQIEMEIWSGLMVSSMLRNTSGYLSIMQYHQGDVWLAPNLFCSRTTTPNIQPMSLRTTFSVKKNKKSWKWRYGLHRAQISTSSSLSGITWGDRRIWGSLHPQRICG